ncbi:zinc ABC transporter substrate-binding protein [Rickettsiales bacterium]|nr:zinc ABC transporter substrate-binding protein [Rickettsiales bacterium]
MKLKILTIFFAIFTTFSSPALAKINIFTCEPEWRSLAQQIAGDNAIYFSATNSNQDPHHIRAKPSLIAKIIKADLLICTGADLEVGWLPLLLDKAKKDLQNGQIGNIMAANFVETIQKPKIIDRSMGDVHPHGNPHIHLDPKNILPIAKEIKNRLQKIDSKNQIIYQNNYNNFSQKWQKSIIKWQKKAKNLKNINIISHHRSFSYLFKWLNINEIATLEPKPGINPSPKHLKSIWELTKNTEIKFIIRANHEQKKASDWLHKRSQITTLSLPITIDKNQNLFDLFDNIIDNLIELL